jgi:hypothetical protein
MGYMDQATEIALVGALLFIATVLFFVVHATGRRVIQSGQSWEQRRWWQPRRYQSHRVLEMLRDPGRQKSAWEEMRQRELMEQLARAPDQQVLELLNRLELLELLAGHGDWIQPYLRLLHRPPRRSLG